MKLLGAGSTFWILVLPLWYLVSLFLSFPRSVHAREDVFDRTQYGGRPWDEQMERT